MPQPKPTRPTDAEMKILRIFWEKGPSTARQIQEYKGRPRPTYTAVLKQLQFMHQKGLLKRDETSHSHVYDAVKSKEKTELGVIRSLVRHSFGGSATDVVMHALSVAKAPPEEIERIRKLLDDLSDKKA